METLEKILAGKVCMIPDYQRGYAWDEKNWKDFVQDIDALIDDEIQSHYTGTIVIYQSKQEKISYGVKKSDQVDIIDGQQRLTTCSLYLSIIINKLIESGEKGYEDERHIYLYSGSDSKLILNNDTSDFYYALISREQANVRTNNLHQQRLQNAYDYLKRHIEEQIEQRENGLTYLKNLFDVITGKMNFTFYSIEEESEIGMTFELMNARGKELSILEKLKNYLMYWIYRNVKDKKKELTDSINRVWKDVYDNIAKCAGNEEQCLRIAWILYHIPDRKKWHGYDGFKENDCIPIRDFSQKNQEQTKDFIRNFTDKLAEISKHYAAILSPENQDQEEFTWLTKINNAGNRATILPLMIAARMQHVHGDITGESYIRLLKALENFIYRVFLWRGKRSTAGISQFYKLGHDLFAKPRFIDDVIQHICWMTNSYFYDFNVKVKEEFNWYSSRRLVKYTLYEYELYLLQDEGQGVKLAPEWDAISDTSIEHILPQNPELNSHWKEVWSEENTEKYLHDISNLVLILDNSHLSNFDFERKKGGPGKGYCYANSDLRQARKIARYDDWTPDSCAKRRTELEEWIQNRWVLDEDHEMPEEPMTDAEDDDDDNE